MNTCYIACALYCELDFSPENTDYVIAADKGYENLINHNIKPNLILGDFDSYGSIPNEENVLVFPVKKDDTDSALAIEHAYKLGYKKIIVYGGIGGELSHTVANLSLIASYAEKGVTVAFVNGNEVAFGIHNQGAEFSSQASGKISVFSHNERAEGVFEMGLLYTLDNYTLTNKTTLGAGNEFIGVKSKISVKNGTLIIITSKNNFDNYLTID